MKRKAILLLSLLSLSSVSLMGISQNPTLVQAEEAPATLPDGWNVATLDEGGAPIVTDYLDATAYKDTSKENSLKLYRRQAGGILKAYSTAFVASPNTSYKVEAFLRSDCLDDEENHLILEASEEKIDGSVVNSTIFDMKGRQNGWKNVYGYFQTSTECSTVTLNVYAEGYGDFFVSDLAMRGAPAPNYFFNTMFTETDVNQASNYGKMTPSWLSDDAYTGEKSLHLNNTGIRVNLTFVPCVLNKKYKMRFRTKNTNSTSNKLIYYFDHYDYNTKVRRWYFNGGFITVSNTEWTTYECDFTLDTGTEFTHLTWINIFAEQEWWIDDIEILDEDGFNYFIDGGFEAYDYSGFNCDGMVGFAKNSDGEFVIGGAYSSNFGTVKSGSMTLTNEQLGLEIGKTYTLSYENRLGYPSGQNGFAFYGNDKIVSHNYSQEWEQLMGSFVATEGSDLRIQFSSFSSYASFVRNISVKDEAGVEHAKCSVKEHVSSGDLGENEFPYGNFAYAFPEIPDQSSSSNGETFSRETEESVSTPAGSAPQGTSSQTPPPDASNDRGPNSENEGTSAAVALPIAISILAVSTAGLAVSIILLLRGKKHV